MCSGRDDDVLDEEGRLLKLALAVEDFHCLLALVELDVLGELVEELVELDVARDLDICVRELLHEALLHVHELVGLGWLWLDLNLGGHVAPQVLDLHGSIVLGVVPRHLGVNALSLPLHVGVVVASLVLAQKLLGFDVVGSLESRCSVEG